MNCQRKLYIRAAKNQANQNLNDFFVTSPLKLTFNSAGLQNIFCNSGVTVPLQLLAIEESIKCKVDVCKHGSPAYDGKECRFDYKQFAHLYITTEINNASIKHYIIAFVESTKIGKYNDLIEVLCCTVSLLKIENERPHFYIYYHGKQPAFDTGLIDARNNITRTLKLRLTNYKKGEAFCETFRVRTDVTNFTIYDSNPYRFTIS